MRVEDTGVAMIRLSLIATFALVLCGCKALALFGDEPTKTVPAEYPYFADKKVCVIVRAPEETIFEHSNVQWEVADHIGVVLEANVHGVTVIDPKKVGAKQRAEPDWQRRDPAALGKELGADRLIEVDLTQYMTREPDSPYLYRGHMAAAVRVYNTEYTNAQPTYKTDIQTVFPPDGPGQWGTNDREVRKGMMEAFAQDVVAKFYDRKVKIK
jgi:hypothetical protein